jgi:class 3 adenylate cyclase/ABC-type lipoprotein export system ATPase subunit
VDVPPQPAAEDELRPVSVLFADLVGSTRLAERLAPDEVKALVGECVNRMCAAVEEYGGMVQATMGDGVCAYFGVPRAREDDADRAARAGLRILEQVSAIRGDVASTWGVENLDVRVGINSGWAAVGVVGGSRPDTVALGDATNVAARLEAAAAPGTILVGEAAARRLGQRFLLEPAGRLAVRGRHEAVEKYVLAGPRPRDALSQTPPLVGRERETAHLRELLAELASGRGRILFLTGEPGIGKSRLLTELRSLAGDSVTWLEGECLSYRALPFHPFVEVLRSWLGIVEGDAEIAVRTKASARLAALSADETPELEALGHLLGIGDRSPPESTIQSTELHRAYRAWLRALAARRPVVVALEDVQWLDSSSRLLAENVLDLTDRDPVLVVATLRPHDPSNGSRLRLHALGDYPHRAGELSLGALRESDASTLLALLRPELDSRTREELVRQAEGNPLYLEELATALAETGLLERGRTWTITTDTSGSLPASLESLLLARVDLLPDSARRLVKTAAVVGRTFPFRVLERLAGIDSLEDDLASLLRSQIVVELGRYPEREYGFKQGLLQEAVLSTLPGATRKALYTRVAAAFDELFPDEFERLAHYHAQSDQPRRALEFLEAAATRAESLGAIPEALDHLERAQRLAAADEDERTDSRIRAQMERLVAAAGGQEPHERVG